MGSGSALAAVRLAVRRGVSDIGPDGVLVVACSGGADSLALLDAALVEGHRGGRTVVGVTVDHALQKGSAGQAAAVGDQMRDLGADEVAVVPVTAPSTLAGGPEARARAARYAALDSIAAQYDAAAVLLGHTRDDQAETVLLGLARGSGARALSGMASVAGRYRRPLLDVPRQDTEAACRARGIDFWVDPHNTDVRFSRVRVRRSVLPVLEDQLGPGVREALARTARLLRDDADALDTLADDAWRQARDERGALEVAELVRCAPAVRRRVLRLAALAAGCPGSELFLVHVDAVDALVTGWHGQSWVDLPGHVRAVRTGQTLFLVAAPVAG